MNCKIINIISVTLIIIFINSFTFGDQKENNILLPTQHLENGVSLMQALKARKSERAFSDKELNLQQISDLLWSANGINRENENLHTAPTAMNLKEIDIYVANSEGLYLYDPKANLLKLILKQDIRAFTGKQAFVKTAPLNLIFVADFSKMGKLSADEAIFYSATDTGFISQNVYLYCSSAGLSTVVRGWLDKAELSKIMKLRDDQKIILAQTVGYPAN